MDLSQTSRQKSNREGEVRAISSIRRTVYGLKMNTDSDRMQAVLTKQDSRHLNVIRK